jgi:hypothetical protein
MAQAKKEFVVVEQPNLQHVRVRIRGTAPLVMHAFGAKARGMMRAAQEAGSKRKSNSKREPKDFDAAFEGARHISTDGWDGIPAPGLRAAMISACRVAGIVMTRAKLTVFVVADGFDSSDQTPLVRITKGEPEPHETTVRLETGVADVRVRPMWRPGWEAVVTIRFDADQMDVSSVINLLSRAGQQVGIGEGRPDSKKSAGIGWGLFEVVADEEESDG